MSNAGHKPRILDLCVEAFVGSLAIGLCIQLYCLLGLMTGTARIGRSARHFVTGLLA